MTTNILNLAPYRVLSFSENEHDYHIKAETIAPRFEVRVRIEGRIMKKAPVDYAAAARYFLKEENKAALVYESLVLQAEREKIGGWLVLYGTDTPDDGDFVNVVRGVLPGGVVRYLTFDQLRKLAEEAVGPEPTLYAIVKAHAEGKI